MGLRLGKSGGSPAGRTGPPKPVGVKIQCTAYLVPLGPAVELLSGASFAMLSRSPLLAPRLPESTFPKFAASVPSLFASGRSPIRSLSGRAQSSKALSRLLSAASDASILGIALSIRLRISPRTLGVPPRIFRRYWVVIPVAMLTSGSLCALRNALTVLRVRFGT
jgi:hypothetical protein